ncbi:MAG: hypothetical protein AB7Q97_14655 [Gammaproteobacteria bacterium]
MLTRFDESLLHQVPLTFAESATSDHRFYDRVFLTVADPAGGAELAVGMGVYKNMNVIDGFAALALPDRQVNVRVSRPLRPEFDTSVGGLRYEVIEPLRRLRLALEPGHGLAFVLQWTATFPVIEEGAWWGTANRVNGRVAIDVRRYEQVGRVSGWIEADGRRIDVRDWFGGRDHSWGVRGLVGGYEPDNGGRLIDGRGMLLTWFLFDCGEFCGVIARTEDDAGRQCGLEGEIVHGDGRPRQRIVEAAVRPRFPAGSRYYDACDIDFSTADGRSWALRAEPIGPTVICKGGGYDGGWSDGRGLGFHRGERVETDLYLPTDDPGTARVLSGATISHNQREAAARVQVNGMPGFGDCTLIAMGELPRYGLGSRPVQL